MPRRLRVAVATLAAVAVLSGCLGGRIADPPPTVLPTPLPTLVPSVLPTHAPVAFEPTKEQGARILDVNNGPKLENIIWRYNPSSVRDISSLVASDGILYLNYRVGDFGSDIHAVDAKTGQLKWRIEDARSPTVAASTIYYSRGCTLYGADLVIHQEIWKFELACAGKYDWIGTPVVQDGVVYFAATASGDNGVYAVDVTSGQRLWKFKTQEFVRGLNLVGDTLYFRIHIKRNDDAKHILWVDGLFALDASSGAEKWMFEPPGGKGNERIIEDMVISNGIVYCTISGYFPSGEEYLYALDGTTGEQRWKFRPRDYAHQLSHLAATDELVYLTTGGGYLHALDAQTGSKQWTFQAGSYFLTPVQVNGVLYLAGNTQPGEGRVYALKSKTGKELRRLLVGSEVTSSPLVLGDTLYVTQAHSGEYLTAVR